MFAQSELCNDSPCFANMRFVQAFAKVACCRMKQRAWKLDVLQECLKLERPHGRNLASMAIPLMFLVCLSAIAEAYAFYGLDSALSQAHLDPLAQNDSFLSLPASIKKQLSYAGRFDTERKIRSILSMQITVPITVKLVGFSDDDRVQLESQVAHYIDVLSRDDRVKIIGGEPHDLVIRTKATVDVFTTSRQLADKVYNAIEMQMQKAQPLSYVNLQPVQHAPIDDIIEADLQKPLSSYVIYILNLKSQARTYGYSYSREDPSPAFSKCFGSLWTGKDRYLWIDLAAGPVEYGPALSGDGLLPRGESHPLATLHSRRQGQKAFVADLASLIWSATRMLFVPSLRIPVHFEIDYEVHFIHIQGTDQEPDSKGLDWDIIEKVFLDESNTGLLLASQRLKFKRHSLKISTCATCVAVVSRSMRSYTSRFLFENYTLFVNEYLDSKQLHFALRHAKHALAIKVGIGHSSAARVVPVYVLDLDHDRPLLLDRFHQAIAFRDMVIAVRTRSSQSASDYTCNGRHVISQIRALERPIVGALLQTLWGITPTHLSWSAQHNSTIVDYTWGVGQTPFGPFSDSLSLSFVQRDAAPRNTLITALNGSISNAVGVLQSIIAEGGEKKILGPRRHVEFMQRWNVFHFKIEKAVSAISHFDFNTALYFIKSSDHDLQAIHRLAYDASSELQKTLSCFRDPPFPWKSALLVCGSSAMLLYVWMRRDFFITNKKKRF